VLESGQAAALKIAGNLIECTMQRTTQTVRSVRATGRDGKRAAFILGVPGKLERSFEGTLEITAVAGSLQSVVTTDLESAVSAAVAAETAPRTPIEALKAQAIVSRSYYFALRHAHKGFDFCDTTHCQFFRSQPGPADPVSQAAKSTEGLVVTFKGQPVATQYFAACGGHTRSMKESRLFVLHYPYFNVECRYCEQHEPMWESRLDPEEAAQLLDAPGSETARMQIIRRLGFGAMPGNNYNISREGDKIVLRGKGRGHGIGLCQAGAVGMAKDGIGFREILNHYFPNTSMMQVVSAGVAAGLQ
jgi:stage II sporulation protein D